MNEDKKIDLKLILSIVATGIMSFSGVVVETAMNVTFPSLMEEFQIGTSSVQWITTGYLLVLAVIIPTSSYLKKRFRMKALFMTAIILFIIGTVLAAVTPVFSLLLLGRLIQGVGTGIALPLMFNITMEQVPEEKLGVMMGTASLITAMDLSLIILVGEWSSSLSFSSGRHGTCHTTGKPRCLLSFGCYHYLDTHLLLRRLSLYTQQREN